MKFWKEIENAKQLAKAGDAELARSTLIDLQSSLTSNSEFVDGRRKVLTQIAISIGIDLKQEKSNSAFPHEPRPLGISIDKYVAKVHSGVSLVTCCMNRNDNLVRALPSWINKAEIKEIIIVDWSSKEHVRERLEQESLLHEKVRVIRVDDEPRWILSYAFNVGFRFARGEKILKVDADIILADDFFEKNILTPSTFIAGDWRIAEAGQQFINGFFYLYRKPLMRIKGFNEYITTYGWDDDEIYGRMRDYGLERKAVDTSTIFHQSHDDAQRTGEQANNTDHIAALKASTMFKIRTNRFLSNVMPIWKHTAHYRPFVTVEDVQNFVLLKPSGETPHIVPKHVRSDGEKYAALDLLSWRTGLRALELDERTLWKLLSVKPLEQMTTLDVEVALENPVSYPTFKERYIVLDCAPGFIENNKNQIESLLDQFVKRTANLSSIGFVIATDVRSQAAALLKHSIEPYFVPRWRNLNGAVDVTDDVSKLLENLNSQSVRLRLNESTINELASLLARDNQSSASKSRSKFYVDAQHGLGNRLRAIGSAAAIAKATNRDLVIVWEPDHHCECRFSDLFDYDGEVIEVSFVEAAQSKGMSVFNYMEIEEGAQKDKPIPKDISGDIYGRAAYVFQSEHSNWASENEFIRSLKPSAQVEKLLEGFELSDCVGVHVRMEAGKGLDHNTYDDVSNWTEEGHEQLHYWRDKSHYSHFIKRIEQLMAEEHNLKLFLATDLPETYKVFQEYFGEKCYLLKRDVFDRSKEQIIYALADAILLSRCNRLLGSTWSSFSELAMRLSTTFSKIEMSGKDF